MGEVYEARHARLSGRYAVKVLNAMVSAQPDAVARFRREAQVTSALRHPSIVQVIDFNTTASGVAYLVMEYLDGANLEKVIDSGGALAIDRAVNITRQVAAALTAAHRKGIVHRDLKPQNIFLVTHKIDDEEPERAKVLDFGISKIRSAARPLTETAVVLGTPQYMSPEQAEGKTADVDAATDQFALAAIAYEMLTGQPAFTGDTLASVVYKVVHQEPEPLAVYRPELPGELQQVVSRGLSKRKGERFPSAADFATALRAAASAPVRRAPLPAPPASVSKQLAAPPVAGRGAQRTLTGMSRPASLRSSPPAGYPTVRGATRSAVKATTLGRHTGELLRLVTRTTGTHRRAIVAAALALCLLGLGVRTAVRSAREPARPAADGLVTAPETTPRAPMAATIQPIAAEPTAPAADAEFDIASDPSGIALWVDGQPYPNPTRQAVTRARGALPAGTHTFELAKLGFQTWRRVVEMTPAAPTRFLARLKHDDVAGATAMWPPPVPATAHVAPPLAPQQLPDITPTPPSGCLLTVGSTPWAEVWIDGDNTLKNTPAVRMTLPCGSHRLDLRRTDLKIHFITSVTLTPGKEVKQKYKLQVVESASGSPP
jgi:tRNA A-37 threonylcarbamoyl transferase component Bud32